MKNLLLLALFFQCVNSTLIGQTTCNISVNTSTIINPKSSNLLGVSYDGRSSMDFDPSPGVNAIGYHNPSNGAIITELQPVFNRIKIGGARYPGNLVSYNWNWSYTIGPFSGRTAQQISTATSLNQKLQFGFDEFMAMTATKGIPSSEVQIMINIYPSQGQSNPAILAADWVEYCNALNDGSNPRRNRLGLPSCYVRTPCALQY
ncbi:MAG: hypothetical protein IPN33_05580 [Saprospiraceae bacterium]|nr:hypothetical protein [Saprospiraceae bacterium]